MKSVHFLRGARVGMRCYRPGETAGIADMHVYGLVRAGFAELTANPLNTSDDEEPQPNARNRRRPKLGRSRR